MMKKFASELNVIECLVARADSIRIDIIEGMQLKNTPEYLEGESFASLLA